MQGIILLRKYLTKELFIKWHRLTHLSDIEFKDFVKLYKDYTKEPFSFLVNDTTYHQIIH